MKEFVAQFRLFTKIIVGTLVSFVGLMQLDSVKNFVTPILAAHPKLASFFAGLTGVGLLMLNPQVRKALHLDDEDAPPPEAPKP